jgi:hypothetical protein
MISEVLIYYGGEDLVEQCRSSPGNQKAEGENPCAFGHSPFPPFYPLLIPI